jgi:hypothetical protein
LLPKARTTILLSPLGRSVPPFVEETPEVFEDE